ncbi:hypothetical protein F0562_034795 [Nyssa sinensis]|uniref:DRBM domain-containing protein n=1 Tax=Nyssa sinensis TaxID=561372 RepID=A0A5J5AAE1_9ASTE|nr:hypothetical protein F0562_034795 [Nyssa sinensis]
MYKNQLQELAQRSCFNLPSYSCVREGPDHSPHFKAKVNFNGEIFDSPTFCSTLRQAEHTAAEVALKTLSVQGPSSALAARVLDETGVYKNLLQETAHRAGLKLPVYITVRAGPGHVPLFNCTVELAGMSFIGEPAKTKRQAQKKAAMTAWFTLKKLSQSSSSTSSLSEFGGKDEQEQVTVAHYLASLQSAEMNKLIQRDHHHGRHELAPVRRDVIPYGAGRSLYPMQHQSWAYSCFSPGVAFCQTRPLERVFQQQSHPLAFPSASTCIPGPQFFPFVQSIFRPDQCPYFLARDQEPVPLVPGIGPFLYLSNHSMPVPVGSNSQVTIQEIDETTQMEEQSLDKDSNYGFWKINSPSNASGLTPTEVPNHPDSLCRHSKLRIQELPHGKDEGKDGNTQNFGQLGTYRNEEFSWIPPGFTSDRDRATSTKEARCRLQNPNNSRYSWSNVRTPISFHD